MKSDKKVLFCGRKHDAYSIRAYKFLLKKFKNVTCIWSKKPGEKKKIDNRLKKIDILISFRNYFIFKKKHLKRVKLLSVNFHPGPPKYRGFGCANYAIYNREKFYVVTAHLMNEKIDNGKILNVIKFKIDKYITLEKLLKLTHKYQVLQIRNVLNKIQDINFDKKRIKKKFNNNYKWSSNLGTKKKLDSFYEIKKGTNLNKLKLKIRSTKIGNYKPYEVVKNKKFLIKC